jgi:hypothetical protein
MIDRTENLLPRLMPAGIGDHELVSVLTLHFGSSDHDTDTRVTLFPMHPPHAIRLVYSRNLEPTGAFAEEALTEKDIETIRAKLYRKYLESAGMGIGQAVLLASARIEGCWRYRDQFQIIPVPAEAPRPSFLLGAHPFLLEFTYNKSSDYLVDSSRRQREGYRIALVLSSLLRCSISWHLPKAVGNRDHAWVQLPNSGQDRNVTYSKIMYDHASIRYIVDAFTPTVDLPSIPLVAAEKY